MTGPLLSPAELAAVRERLAFWTANCDTIEGQRLCGLRPLAYRSALRHLRLLEARAGIPNGVTIGSGGMISGLPE